MLMLNFIRALMILSGFGLYHIYNKDFLTWDQGLVIFLIGFFGLMLWEIVEGYVISAFNGEAQTNPSAVPSRWLAGRGPRSE